MTLTWAKENLPRWDADKRRLFGPAELASVGLSAPADGDAVAGDWWHAADDGQIVGYGWLDSEWGDAQITFLAAPDRRGQGVGDFILGHLEREAAARGLNYIYNVVPGTHPDGPWIRRWLTDRGFRESPDGHLRRQTTPATAGGDED